MCVWGGGRGGGDRYSIYIQMYIHIYGVCACACVCVCVYVFVFVFVLITVKRLSVSPLLRTLLCGIQDITLTYTHTHTHTAPPKDAGSMGSAYARAVELVRRPRAEGPIAAAVWGFRASCRLVRDKGF
jgi:hypothetical protein